MKKAIVVSISKAQFAPILFSARLDEGFRIASELGYDGVELAIRDPAVIDRAHIEALAGKYKMEIPALGTGQAFGEEGLSFSDPDNEVRLRAMNRVKSHVDLAREWKSRVIVGLIRGRLPRDDEGFAAGRRWSLAALKDVGLYAESKGVEILLEPINRYETNLLNTVGQTAEFIAETGAPNLKILIDTFHGNIEEVSIFGAIETYGGLIAHAHLVDSNREAPGRGHLDIAGIIKTLKSVGYNGYVSMEMLPLPDDAESARIAIENLIRFGA